MAPCWRARLAAADPVRLRRIDRGKMVSVIGKLGMPEGSSESKLIVEKIVLHEDIAVRAQTIHQSGEGGSAEDDWLRAEGELLGVDDRGEIESN